MILSVNSTWCALHIITRSSGRFVGQREFCPTLHALMAVLSAAPVASADGIGAANVTLLRQLARADGLVLRPDVPAMPNFLLSFRTFWSVDSVFETIPNSTRLFLLSLFGSGLKFPF